MKPKKRFLSIINFLAAFLLVVPTFLMMSLSSSHARESFQIDPVHSSIIFKINHLGVTSFYGRFNNPSGTFTIDKENPENNFAEIMVKVENVDTYNEKRDAHLKNQDFFHADQHPDGVFKTSSCKKLENDKFEVSGHLTFHGITKPIVLEVHQTGAVDDPWGNFRMGFETSFSILRSDFGMDKMLDLVGDEVYLMIAIEGIHQKSQP